MGLVYNTQRVVQIPSKCLAITNTIISLFVIVYIGGYGLWYCRGYQATSPIESVVVSKVKGVVSTTKYTDAQLSIPNPQFYRRIWDASDVVILSHGDQSGGFVILTNVVITSSQTRGTCPESVNIERSKCKTDAECQAGQVRPLGNGPLTGKCVVNDYNQAVKTCQIEAWCPVEQDKIPLNSRKALLEGTKDFTVLIKNSIEFPSFGPYYKRRNIMDSATSEHLQSCIYNSKTDPYCPTFKIGDIVTGAGESFEQVALTGGVFAIKIGWFCSFDFGASINDCRPKYSFSRLDNPKAFVAPGFNFRSADFHEENRRTLTRNYGLKIVIDVEGEGRKFDSVRLVLAFGAGMGLFGLASVVCDFIFKLFCTLKKRFKWKWLQWYHEEMKYDLTHMKPVVTNPSNSRTSTSAKANSKSRNSHELDEVKSLK